MVLNINSIKEDFPIFQREIRPGIPLIYLDSTATSQKPAVVIDTMDSYYRRNNANIHRGVHTLAEEATGMYEEARKKVARFINARSHREIIFTKKYNRSQLISFLKHGHVSFFYRETW